MPVKLEVEGLDSFGDGTGTLEVSEFRHVEWTPWGSFREFRGHGVWSFGDRRSNHHRKCRALAKADLMGSIDLFVQLSRFSSNKT
jgi:hypothetical protein